MICSSASNDGLDLPGWPGAAGMALVSPIINCSIWSTERSLLMKFVRSSSMATSWKTSPSECASADCMEKPSFVPL